MSIVFYVLAGALWVSALFPAAFIQRTSGATQYTGLNCLLLGWFGLFGVFRWGLPWLANAGFAMGLFAAIVGRPGTRQGLIFSVAAIPLALVTYTNKTIPVDEAGNTVAVTIGPAFYLWLGSLVALALGHALGELRRLHG